MDSITTPDEYGGLYVGDHVSFIIVPARKGVQAADVTLEDEPKQEEEIKEKMDELNLDDGDNAKGENGTGETKAVEVADEWDLGAWGT